jgi:hypothetical protein
VQLEALFIYCLVWSCGAALVQQPGATDRDRCAGRGLAALLLLQALCACARHCRHALAGDLKSDWCLMDDG